jgi:hypothetical protein|tara:strand:+ start:1677 stop:1964 length:288 start_codon:yes stop_codon:yes gene_type:complete
MSFNFKAKVNNMTYQQAIDAIHSAFLDTPLTIHQATRSFKVMASTKPVSVWQAVEGLHALSSVSHKYGHFNSFRLAFSHLAQQAYAGVVNQAGVA